MWSADVDECVDGTGRAGRVEAGGDDRVWAGWEIVGERSRVWIRPGAVGDGAAAAGADCTVMVTGRAGGESVALHRDRHARC